MTKKQKNLTQKIGTISILTLLIVVTMLNFYTPTTTATDVNLAPIPSNKWSYGDNKIIFNDTSVTHNGHTSLRVEQTDPTGVPVNVAREVNTVWTRCTPGDIILFRVYAKTAGTSLDNLERSWGAYMGFDFYGSSAAVDGQPHGEKQYENGTWYSDGDSSWVGGMWRDYSNSFVDRVETYYRLPYGNPDWILLEWNVTVPSRTYTIDYNSGVAISEQPIYGFIAWFGARGQQAPDVWFADAELYINPTGLPDPSTEDIYFDQPTYGAESYETVVEGDGFHKEVAQTFTVDETFTLTKVGAYLDYQNTPQNAVFEIREMSGTTITTTVLSTGTIASGDLVDGSFNNCTMSEVELQADTTYALVISYPTGTGTNFLKWHHTSNTIAGISSYISTDTGVTFVADESQEMSLIVYGEAIPVDTYYSITELAHSGEGTLTFDPSETTTIGVLADSLITVTPQPSTGYRLKEVYLLTYPEQTLLTTYDNSQGAYETIYIIMNDDYYIQAVFELDLDPDPVVPTELTINTAIGLFATLTVLSLVLKRF